MVILGLDPNPNPTRLNVKLPKNLTHTHTHTHTHTLGPKSSMAKQGSWGLTVRIKKINKINKKTCLLNRPGSGNRSGPVGRVRA